MEGASGIFDERISWLRNGTPDWRNHGRDCITSDTLAVVNAAIDFGIDDILLYDAHFAGNPEFNIILEKLPSIVRVFDIPDRCFYWRRIRGQAAQNPFGIITLGQHARNGEPDAYFAHTIQTPPIKNIYVNGLHVAEIGSAVLNFAGTPYLANIGCRASMREARELSDTVATISVKDKAKNWEPTPQETYPIIYEGTMKALREAGCAKTPILKPPFVFSMELCDGYYYKPPKQIAWAGEFEKTNVRWFAPDIEIGFELFNYVRECIYDN